ncbi:neuropeptide SIFamide receptor-like [Actinia tenebrosa]|uniref:Neuropeptide SIFamide receptor-like n=1 Tax=Actinia tenebrosa TaxID=6105 RepID=A0A6P8HPN6_ACTTE|nr:neuropeptide SIFamide receptor-like [Actinia tenebrosa]
MNLSYSYRESNNTTAAPNSKCPEWGQENSTLFQVVFISLYSIMGLTALFGNSFLVKIIFSTPRMKTSFNYFIANMAISDIIVQFCVIPRIITDILYEARRWLIGDTIGQILCKLLYYVQDVCTAVSIECIVLIAIDRFLAVVTPTKVRSTSRGKLRVVIIIMTWIIAMVLHAPYLHFTNIRKVAPDVMYCTIDWSPLPDAVHTKYMSILIVLLFLIPLGIITILYSIIFMIVKRRKIPGHQSSDRRQFRHYEKAKTNVLQLSIAVVAVFIISWTPTIVNLLLLMTKWGWRVPCDMIPFRFFALFMNYSNTATNPWIYFVLSANYRQGIRKLIPCAQWKAQYQKRLSSRTKSGTWATHQTDSGAEADIGQTLPELSACTAV